MADELTLLFAGLFAVDDRVVREIMNGMWFVLSIEILASLVFYIIHRARQPMPKAEWVWVCPVRWYDQPGIQLAVALGVYLTGSTIRAGWVWSLLECENRVGRSNCPEIIASAGWLYLASVFAIVGAVCTIRVMLLGRWRPWSWIVPALVAITVPICVHVFR